jgi:hypothetical protein
MAPANRRSVPALLLIVAASLGAAPAAAATAPEDASQERLPAAQAEPSRGMRLSSLSAGFTYVTPLGDAYAKVERKTGVLIHAGLETPGLPAGVELQATALYQPLTVRSLDATLGILGIYAGARVTSTTAVMRLQPFFAVELGTAYDYLNFNSRSDEFQNTALGFSTQVTPGLELPLGSRVGIVAEMPFTAIFYQETVTLWSANFSARWKL